MSSAVCPYCRGPIEDSETQRLVCSGCGTPHHADCYTENGGCTVFGCSAAPAEEPKLSLSGSDLATAPASGPLPSTTTIAPGPPAKVAPPPPLPGLAAVRPEPMPVPRAGVGSVLFAVQPVPLMATGQPAMEVDLTPNPEARNRMTFVVLGVLLGALGAHNFYAGYRGKGIAQLFISVLSLGLASPMSWAWAVIDVCTVDRDHKGVKFRS